MYFSPSQYHSQFLSYTVPGMIGLVLNAWMVIGLVVMGKRARKKLPAAVICLFPLGLLYGIIDSLPGTIAKFTVLGGK